MTIAPALDARTELRTRIRASHMADALAGMCADLCMEQVEPEQALERIQEKALEQLVSLLDTRILADAEAMDDCLGLIAEESGRIACEALEKGMARLREGLALLESLESNEEMEGIGGEFASGSVN
jgi:predicted subunit of tRNA(5-methylaminomethyl-2-thiouridylate) methyltransferase